MSEREDFRNFPGHGQMCRCLSCENANRNRSMWLPGEPLPARKAGAPIVSEWQPIESAPRDNKTRIIVLTERGRVFKAYYAYSVADNEEGPCDSWSVDGEDEPRPRCWTDGLCWASNEDEERSDWPTHWMPLPAPPQLPEERRMETDTLLPCPFCGADPDEIGMHGKEEGWNMVCYVCHVETAYCETDAEALAAWNRRAPLNPPSDSDGGEG